MGLKPVEAELVTSGVPRGQEHIRIIFNGFQPHYIRSLKAGVIPGARFVGANKGDPHWRIAIDIDLAKKMRAVFGDDLTLGPKLKKWAKKKLAKGNYLSNLTLGDTATLTRLPELLPDLYEAIHLGPRGRFMTPDEREHALAHDDASYQAADTLYVATADNPIDTKQPGTGKTLTTIAGIYEGGFEHGPKLVVAPVSSHELVWEPELTIWQNQPFTICPEGKRARENWMVEVWNRYAEGEDFWAILNWQMIQYRTDFIRCEMHSSTRDGVPKAKVAECKKCEDCQEYLRADYPDVFEIPWTVAIMDEFHKMGLRNPATLTYETLEAIPAQKKILLSGTPMGGKPINFFGILSFVDPKTFTSKWTFASTWLTVTESDIRVAGGKERTVKSIGDVAEDKEDAFSEMLSRYIIRRTKEECLPWLPPKQYRPVWPDGSNGIWVEMSGKQRAQYEEFAEMAEIMIDEEELSATSVLAEYTRLKQFAMAAQTITGRDLETGKPFLLPTTDSCKIPPILDILDERGIRPGDEAEGDEQVVIYSQFTQIVDMLTDELQRLGYPAERFHGGTTKKKRKEVHGRFMGDGDLRVLVMNVQAGGVSINLDRASTVVFTDETWDPDDHEQAEDRVHRGSRIHQVQIYYIRTKGTIEEDIEKRVMDKSRINRDILDLRRMGLRAIHK